MARTTVRKPAWSPQATWSAALRLGDLVIEGERWPVFEARGLTREGVTELRTDAETFKVALAAGTGLEAQLAATVALTTQCEQAGKVSHPVSRRIPPKQRERGGNDQGRGGASS